MTPGKHDLALYRGDSYAFQAKLWSDPEHTIPNDLTGATAAAQLRDKFDGTNVIDLECEVVPPNAVNVALTALAWEGVEEMPTVWDLEITYPSGAVSTVLAGKVKVTLDVTV